MKPLTLKPDETKSLASGRVVIWREIEGEPFNIGNKWGIVFENPYQPGAEFWLTWYSDEIKTGTIVRVVSVSPEQRETWGWRVELEVI